MINWTQFESDLVRYFTSHTARSENDTAKYIANLYELYVRTGSDVFYNNRAITFNKVLLENAFKIAFNQAKNGVYNLGVFTQQINTGLIGFWTGAILSSIVPPPGTIGVVSNNVTVPGTPQTLIFRNTTNTSAFAKNITTMFRIHMLTVSGITIALVPTPTGAAIPTPFPWQGYQ